MEVTTVKCFRCNREGHHASDKEKCRTVTQTCNTCSQKGHFSGAKFYEKIKRSQGSSKQFTPKERKPDSRKGTQNHIEEGVAVVSFAAVFRLVTQRSSPQTAAFFRTTFLSLCLSVQAIDQSYHNHCLNSNQSKCSKKTFPRITIWNVDQRKPVRSFYSSVFET